MTDDRTAGRLQLLLIGLVFIGPLVASFFIYFGGVWSPESSAIHGVLFEAPRLLPDDPFSPDIQTSRFRDKWSLVHIAQGVCSDGCRESLVETRQVRQALNREQDRVQRILCSQNAQPNTAYFEQEHRRLIIIDYDSSACDMLIELTEAYSSNEVFLVDPLGNLIMRFPSDTGMRGMHRDLKKLLRASRIG